MDFKYIPPRKNRSKKEVATVAERWKGQYCHLGVWYKRALSFSSEKDAEGTYRAIVKAKTLDDIDNILGNISWTHNYCRICSTFTRKAVIKFHDGESLHNYCKPCVKDMLKAFKSSSTSS